MVGLGNFIAFLAICTVAFFIGTLFGIWTYFFGETKIESKHLIQPEIVIHTESVNGLIKSDTTYIYKSN